MLWQLPTHSEKVESVCWSAVLQWSSARWMSPSEYLASAINDIRSEDVIREWIWQPWIPEPRFYLEQFLWERMEGWIEEDIHRDRQYLKKALRANIQRITFADFQKNLSLLARKIAENLWDEPYAVLFDDQPHKSKYWTWNLLKDQLPQATLDSHFYYVFEEGRKDDKSTLSLSREKWINTYLVVDDAIFTGQQIWHRILAPLKRCCPQARVVVATPYATKKWIINLGDYNPKVEVLSIENIPTIKEVIPKEVLHSWDKSWDSPGELRQDATLTYFDHRMADGQSFCQPIADIVWARIVKPYDISGIRYYDKEEKLFDEYRSRIDYF